MLELSKRFKLGKTRLMLVFSCCAEPGKAAFTQFRGHLGTYPETTVIPIEPLEEKQVLELLHDSHTIFPK